VPSCSATVAPFASSVSTCACARGGSVTCEPSEKRSDSGAESAATRRSPTAPVRPAPAPSTANESGVGRITKIATPAAHAAAPSSDSRHVPCARCDCRLCSSSASSRA